MIALRIGLLISLTILTTGTAVAQSELAITPDEARILINKDVAGLRWAIVYDPEKGVVTGNVYSPGGDPPQFLWCTEEERGGSEITFECRATNACNVWEVLEPVQIAESFFAPRPPTAIERVQRAPNGVVNGGVSAPASARYTPDGSAILISKDVGGERWAITVLHDGTVFGNVFSGDGQAPTFLSCSRTAAADGSSTFECAAAGDAGWRSLGEVVVPTEFFAVRCPATRSPAPDANPCDVSPLPLLPSRVYDIANDPFENPVAPIATQIQIEELDLGERWNGYGVLREVTTVMGPLAARGEVSVGCTPELGAVLLATHGDTRRDPLMDPIEWDPPLPRCQEYGMEVGTRCEWQGLAPLPSARSLQTSALIAKTVVGYEDVSVPAGIFANVMVLEDETRIWTPIIVMEEGLDGVPHLTLVGYEFVPVVTRLWIDERLGVVRTRCESGPELCSIAGIELAPFVPDDAE